MRFAINILLIALIFGFSCKKYPENNLWFKRPIKALARGDGNPWKLIFYSVNDLDSTSSNYLNAYKEEGLVISSEEGHEKYNCIDILSGSWEFFDKKKVVSFKFSTYGFLGYSPTNINYNNQRNIFLESGLRWKIEKLTKKEFWISSELNSKKYEIHFQ